MTQAFTQNFTEVHEIDPNWLPPANKVPATYTTSWYDMACHQRAAFILMTGVMTATSDINLQIYQAQDAGGTGRKVITGKAITALHAADGDGNDICAIEFLTEELDVNNRFSFIRAELVITDAASYCCLLPLYGTSNLTPVTAANWTEIITA